MLKVENIDLEYPQIGREPKMGYADEYIEKTMMSGLIKRIYSGKRFYATFSYAYLLNDQRATINALLSTQRTQGYLNVVIDTPFGQYAGPAILELSNEQTRFTYSEVLKDYVWTNWSLTLKGARYDS